MCRGGRMVDQGFDAAERLGEGEDATPLQQPEHCLLAAVDTKRESVAETTGLPQCEIMLRVARKAGVLTRRRSCWSLLPARRGSVVS